MRWIVRVGLAIVVLGLLLAGAVALIPAERVAAVAATKFESLTGRKLELEGGVSPTFWPTLGVKTGPVRIANAAWSTEGPMLEADALTIDINLSALWGGEVQITGIEVVRPKILLERGRDGLENWVFGGSAGGTVTAETPGVGRAYTLGAGVVRDGSFRFIDHRAGSRIVLDAVNAELSIPDFAGPVTLTGSAVSGGQRVALIATAGDYAAFTVGKVVPFLAKLTAGGSVVKFDGRLGTKPLVAEGALDADLGDLPALAALTGATAPALPQGFGADGLTLEGQLTLAEGGAMYLRKGTLVADGNVLSGDVDLTPGPTRRKLSAQLSAGNLVLHGVGGAGTGAAAGGNAASEGWSDAPINVAGLGMVDAVVSLAASSIDLGSLKLGITRLVLSVDRARAVFDIREMSAYGGKVSGEFVMNGRGGLSVGGKLGFAGLAMQPLLNDLIGYDRLIGTGDLDLNFLGVGNSIHAIMQGLKGNGSLELGRGELRGLDLAGMLRTLDAGYVGDGQKTIFDGVAGSFTIADGVLSNEDLKLVAPYVTASGTGEVGIGAQTLNYRLRPTALAAEDGSGGVMVPLLISGTWAKPKFRLDLESIAREKMQAEAEAAAKEAEARANAALAAKLKDELGVELLPGESLEDAARRRAKEVLDAQTQRLLQDLLNGN